MKVTLIYSALFLCLGVSLAYGDDITTLDGKTYYQANVISKTHADMTVEYSKTPDTEDKAITTIKSSKLDEAAQKKYGFNDAERVGTVQKTTTPVNNLSAGKADIENSKKNAGFDIQEGAPGQQYLIQKTKLSNIQDSMNARYQAEMKEMDDNAN